MGVFGMSFYKKHVFFCVNQKENGRKCCQMAEAESMCHYMKARLRELDLKGEGKFAVSSSGCLGRCSVGPNLVIYPEGIWYTYHDLDDIDEIIESHLLNDEVVERLLNKNTPVAQ